MSSEPKDDAVTTVIDKMKPIVANITFGGVMGLCSGMAFKKISKNLAVIIGTGFAAIQIAVGLGYIDVNWTKVKGEIHAQIDITKDGKLDTADAKEWWTKLRTLLTHKVPSAGGFSLGFLYGARYG
jgi:uncharacterized membrane protein (Fun14 family)